MQESDRGINLQHHKRLIPLPSIPSVYMTLNEALANDATGAADIAKIIEQDPAMSAKLLQLVNSAFFSLNSHVFKIKDAVVILGVSADTGSVSGFSSV